MSRHPQALSAPSPTVPPRPSCGAPDGTVRQAPPGGRGALVARRVALLASGWLVVACGGGGGYGGGMSSPPPAPPPPVVAAGTWADGPVTGFGSVIVNGVRFDDDTADVSDDEGRTLHVDDLRLGMEVEIEAGDDHGGRATASGVHVHGSVTGPVEAVDAVAGTLVVLGQSVDTDAGTALDDALPGGLASLVPGAIVRIHGPADPSTGVVHATRVERAGAVGAFRVHGRVGALDAAAHRITIGAATFDFTDVADVPGDLAVGSAVALSTATAPLAAGVWRVTSFSAEHRHFGDDHGEAQLRGTVSTFTSTADFTVGTTRVDASHATFPDGTGALAGGALVEVEGTLVDGALVARTVTLEDRGGDHAGEVELHGTVSQMDGTSGTFVLRASIVSLGGSPSFTHGTAADLVNGAHVEVTGHLAADGHTVVAEAIEFEAD